MTLLVCLRDVTENRVEWKDESPQIKVRSERWGNDEEDSLWVGSTYLHGSGVFLYITNVKRKEHIQAELSLKKTAEGNAKRTVPLNRREKRILVSLNFHPRPS